MLWASSLVLEQQGDGCSDKENWVKFLVSPFSGCEVGQVI